MVVQAILPVVGQRFVKRDAGVPDVGTAEQRWAWAMAGPAAVAAVITASVGVGDRHAVQYVMPGVPGIYGDDTDAFYERWRAL